MRVGVDLISADKFTTLTKEDYKHWERVFSPYEWDYAFRDQSFHLHLAGLFAAKEAAMKATGEVGVGNYRTFEISHDETGAPHLELPGSSVSISHDTSMVIAVVLVP